MIDRNRYPEASTAFIRHFPFICAASKEPEAKKQSAQCAETEAIIPESPLGFHRPPPKARAVVAVRGFRPGLGRPTSPRLPARSRGKGWRLQCLARAPVTRPGQGLQRARCPAGPVPTRTESPSHTPRTAYPPAAYPRPTANFTHDRRISASRGQAPALPAFRATHKPTPDNFRQKKAETSHLAANSPHVRRASAGRGQSNAIGAAYPPPPK